MKLIFERRVPGRRCRSHPASDVEETPLPESLRSADAGSESRGMKLEAPRK